MRRHRVNYESIEGVWLFYIGISLLGLSLLYMLFFASKWPYPLRPFLALILSFLLSGGIMCYGHLYNEEELQVRKTFITVGLGAYILWYVLYVRATIYCNAGLAYHTGLAVLLIFSLSFIIYSLAVKGNKVPNLRIK